MRNYKIMAAALMMATMMAGCSQDEGNYDYHSLNEPTITGVPETISVLTHANIDLDPNRAITSPTSMPTTTSGRSSISRATKR